MYSFKLWISPLLNIVNYITSALNNNEIAVAIFLDFRKAFDVVNHDILLLKLGKLGVKNKNLSWFRSYLKDRKQFTMVNNLLSDFFTEFNVSVPQGSILGPLLFLIYINDMHMSNNLKNFHFADDSTGLAKGSDINEVGRFVNQELQKLGMWLRANKISINTDKTKVMVFHLKQKPVSEFQFYFNNNDINSVACPDQISKIEKISNSSSVSAFKMLGILFDENLTFNQHFKQVRNKIAKALFFINKAQNILSSVALKSLYYALVHPHLLYCLPIYSCSNNKNINSLFNMQKKCIRIISKAKYSAHSQPLFYSLNILPLQDLITQQQRIIIHSIVYNYSRVSYEDVFKRNSDLIIHNYPLRNADELSLPHARNEYLKRFPFYSFPRLWNNLDPTIKSIGNINTFKFILKKCLLEKYAQFECERLLCYSCLTMP